MENKYAPKVLYVDGGCKPDTGAYFSFAVYQNGQLIFKQTRQLEDDDWPTELPLVHTNNTAEYAALYAGIRWFRIKYGGVPLIIKQDSKLIVNQVNGVFQCNKPHLKPWLFAVQQLKHPQYTLEWVRRKEIYEVLGH